MRNTHGELRGLASPTDSLTSRWLEAPRKQKKLEQARIDEHLQFVRMLENGVDARVLSKKYQIKPWEQYAWFRNKEANSSLG